MVQTNSTKMNHIELSFNSITRTSTGKHLYYTENFVCSRNNCFACQYWLYSTQCYLVDISGLLNIVAFEVNKKIAKCQMYKTIFNFVHFCPTKITKSIFNYPSYVSVGGTAASWLVPLTPDRTVWVWALAGNIVLCSWARHYSLSVSLPLG